MKIFNWGKINPFALRREKLTRRNMGGDNWREEVTRQFSNWLYELTDKREGIAFPEDIGDDIPDLYSFYEELTALRGEVGHQTRAVKQAGRAMKEELETIADDSGKQGERIFGLVEGIRDDLRNLKSEVRSEFLREIIEIRESIYNTCRVVELNKPAGRLWNRGALRLWEKTRESQERLIRKVDDLLLRLGVSPLARQGDKFNAGIMRAISVNETSSHPSGLVTEVIRQGYRWEDKILRYAEVEVAK
ncbi:MAG: nucleotide exchange factor GrpE [Candidatus Auribacterota bacterium]|nr:nucleotide exchange factor GrpE [Candidatus Auribacterota bacterium]